MKFYLALPAIMLLAGLWNIMIAILGLFPQLRATAVGTLTKTHTHRNIQPRRGAPIAILARYTYTYNVKGKTYRYTGEMLRSERCLLRKVTMHYVKGFPRRAYPNKFRGTMEWFVGFMLLFFGTLLMIMMVAR
ncbi:MAG: hypothetical protein IKM08_03670 [Clostridia bacterium]|nr:hypothetical protein [Clostridia bacterium]MBR6727269.1 hypothetical protein [Clostridia bacterium]